MGAVETVIDGAMADRDSTSGALSSSSGATRRSESSRDRNRASSLVTWLRCSSQFAILLSETGNSFDLDAYLTASGLFARFALTHGCPERAQLVQDGRSSSQRIF